MSANDDFKCAICDSNDPFFSWTDTHGIGRHIPCGATYRLYHYENNKRVDKPAELTFGPEWVPLMRRYWQEQGRSVWGGLHSFGIGIQAERASASSRSRSLCAEPGFSDGGRRDGGYRGGGDAGPSGGAVMTPSEQIRAACRAVEEMDRAATKGPWRTEKRLVSFVERDFDGDGGYDSYDTFLVRGSRAAQVFSAATRHDRVGSAPDYPHDPDAIFMAASRSLLPAFAKALEMAVSVADGHEQDIDVPHRCAQCRLAWPCPPVEAVRDIASLLTQAQEGK